MLYIKIKENTKQAKLFIQYIKTLPFVEFINIKDSDKITKEQFIADIKTSLTEVKEKKTKPLKRLFDGK
jgi:hypothetical protein